MTVSGPTWRRLTPRLPSARLTASRPPQPLAVRPRRFRPRVDMTQRPRGVVIAGRAITRSRTRQNRGNSRRVYMTGGPPQRGAAPGTFTRKRTDLSMTMTVSPALIAHAYRLRGWSLFPLPRGQKAPDRPWKQFQSNRPSDHVVDTWFRQRPDSNVAIVTGAVSGLVVADLDLVKHPNAAREFAERCGGVAGRADRPDGQRRPACVLQPSGRPGAEPRGPLPWSRCARRRGLRCGAAVDPSQRRSVRMGGGYGVLRRLLPG